MALYRFTVKTKRFRPQYGIIEPGMSIELSSIINPLSGRKGQQEIRAAFIRKYNIDLEKFSALNNGALSEEILTK